MEYTYRDAESLVAEALRSQGWAIIAQNIRTKHSELDIVAQKHSTLIVVEVKLRRSRSLNGDISGLLPNRKKAALRRGFNAFLRRYSFLTWQTLRFDLAVVARDQVGMRINYYPNCFEY